MNPTFAAIRKNSTPPVPAIKRHLLLPTHLSNNITFHSQRLHHHQHQKMAASETRSELQKTFQGRPAAQHISGWDDLWKKSLTPWDRAGPSQALRDAILSQNQNLFGSPIKKLATTTGQQQQQQRKKALVPGCGRGYDVLSLASLGYDTVGLDGSENAILAARKLEAEEISCESDAYRLRDPLVGKGKVQFIIGDFFHEDFLAAITSTTTTTHGDSTSNNTVPPTTKEEKFDLIFDYTFLCALPRELRPTWAKRMSELLAPDGFLVCLEWPLQKSPKEGGPPHGLSAELYEELLRKPGQEVEYDDDNEGYVVVSAGDSTTSGGGDDGRARNALVRLERYRPSRTHEAGKDSDYISIWKRAGN